MRASPIEVINGHTELLSSNLETSSAVRKSIQALQEAVKQASGVTRSLLSFSSRLGGEKRPLNLNDAYHKTAHLLRCTLAANIRLELDFERNLPWVYGDKIEAPAGSSQLGYQCEGCNA